MTTFNMHKKSNSIPNILKPSKLAILAASAVARLLVYEDYEECNFYRWDPMRIWQFKPPESKKKKKPTIEVEGLYSHPPQPWKLLKILRDWWYEESFDLLGSVDSPMRALIVGALEVESWTAETLEEDLLFLILRICLDTHIEITQSTIDPIPEEWYGDIAQVIDQLGPLPLVKLTFLGDKLSSQGNTSVLVALVKNAPNLKILKFNQWDISNTLLVGMSENCHLLQELSILSMDYDVYINEPELFMCFFSGLGKEEVCKYYERKECPPLSFPHLKFVDILYYHRTEILLNILSYFCPSLRIASLYHRNEDSGTFIRSVLENSASLKINFNRMSLNIEGLVGGFANCALKCCHDLKELSLHMDGEWTDTVGVTRKELAQNKLKEIGSKMGLLEYLNIRPSVGVKPNIVVEVFIPLLDAIGKRVKTLHFTYDSAEFDPNVATRFMNQCLDMETVIVETWYQEEPPDNAEESEEEVISRVKVNMQTYPALETLILKMPETDIEELEEKPSAMNLNCLNFIKDLFGKAPKLRNVSLGGWNPAAAELLSESVKFLQIECPSVFFSSSSNSLRSVLQKFPSLREISFNIWPSEMNLCKRFECVENRGVILTKKSMSFSGILPYKRERERWIATEENSWHFFAIQ